MVNRSRPTQAKRAREKALIEKRQQKSARRQDAKVPPARRGECHAPRHSAKVQRLPQWRRSGTLAPQCPTSGFV